MPSLLIPHFFEKKTHWETTSFFGVTLPCREIEDKPSVFFFSLFTEGSLSVKSDDKHTRAVASN